MWQVKVTRLTRPEDLAQGGLAAGEVKREPPSEGRRAGMVKAASTGAKTLAAPPQSSRLANTPAGLTPSAMIFLCSFLRAMLACAGLLAFAAELSAAESKQSAPTDLPDQPPTRFKVVAPSYPFNMRQAGLIGTVDLEFIVDVEGRVINPVVVRSNNPWFERPAIEAILQWKFHPGLKSGHAVNSVARQRIQFELDDVGSELWRATKAKDHAKLPLEIRWDESPVPIMSTYPVYPAEALRAEKKGRAVVRYLVNQQGRIDAAKVMEASAPEFGGAAMASVDVWRFSPAKRAGEPCSALIQVEFEFMPYGGTATVPISIGMRDIGHELRRKEPRIYPLDKLDAVPKPLSRRPPVYPSVLREAGRPGEALIEFYIDPKGDAQLPRIVSASVPEFGYAAAQAVSTWRFEPPMKAGKAVIARAQIPVNFQLPEAGKPMKAPAAEEARP